MARVGITFEQVAAAADALLGAGKQPTIQSVRESLGTGSPNTVHKHLTAWRAARPQAVSAAVEMSSAMQAAYADDISRATAKARSEIEEQLVRALADAAELSSTGEALENERDALLEQVGGLTTERDQAAATAAERALEIERNVQTIQREQQAAESARVDLAKAQLKIEAGVERAQELTSEVQRLRTALEAAQVGRQVAEQAAAVTAAQLTSEQSKSTDLAARLTASEKSVQKANEATEKAQRGAEDLRVSEKTLQASLDAVTRDLEALKVSEKESRAEAKKSADEAAELRGKLASIKPAKTTNTKDKETN